MRGGKYAKNLANIQVRGIFHIRDIGKKCFTQIYGDAMLPDELQHGGRKPTETSVNLFFEELIKIEVILFLIHELFR